MFGRLMPREGRFFELFNQHADLIAEGSRELAALMATGDDFERRAHNVESIEKRGDRVTRNTIELLHRTFITPLDRDEIRKLISEMDNILDLIEDSAQVMYLYNVRAPPPDAKKLPYISVDCCDKVKNAVTLLSSMEYAPAIMALCDEIDHVVGLGFQHPRSAITINPAAAFRNRE